MTQDTAEKITISLNGSNVEVDSGLTLGQLVDQKGLVRQMIAIEYNGEILPRHQYDNTMIHAGDVLEVVQMVGGG
jgi:thiamine biosynthesis protein ThiS